MLLLNWFQPPLERGEGVELTSCQMTVVAKQRFQKILYNCVLNDRPNYNSYVGGTHYTVKKLVYYAFIAL